MGDYLLLLLREHQSQLLWPGAAGSLRIYYKGWRAVHHNLVSTPTCR